MTFHAPEAAVQTAYQLVNLCYIKFTKNPLLTARRYTCAGSSSSFVTNKIQWVFLPLKRLNLFKACHHLCRNPKSFSRRTGTQVCIPGTLVPLKVFLKIISTPFEQLQILHTISFLHNTLCLSASAIRL